MKMKPLRALCLLILLILALPGAGWSQVTNPGTGGGSGAQEVQTSPIQELLDRIRQTDGELVALMDSVTALEGEALYMARVRIGQLASLQEGNLGRLGDLMADPDGPGPSLALVEQQGEQLLRRSSRRLRSYIQSLQVALEEEALKRPDLAPEEVQVFEHRIAEDSHRLDGFYQSLARLKGQMEDLDLEVGEETAFLERELMKRGESLLQVVELTRTRLSEFRGLLANAPDDRDLQAQAFATEERYESNKASLMATIRLLRGEGLDYSDLEVRAVEITGEITPEAFQIDVAVGLFAREVERVKTFLADHGPRLLLRGLVILSILLAFWALAGIVRGSTRRILDRTKVANSTLLKQMIVTLAGRLVLLLGLIIALSQFGIDMGPVLAGLGIAGFVVGFALQDTLANFAAGAMILAYRPFDVGDMVEAAGVMGMVKDMNLVSTRILTIDHQTLIIPNSKIWGDVIRNVTAQPMRRVDMVFGISYRDEIPKAESVLGEILASHPKTLDEPEPMVKVHTLNESSVDFVVRPWVRTEDYWEVYWDITREVKMRFDAEGISIPFPQRDVHLFPQGGPALDPA